MAEATFKIESFIYIITFSVVMIGLHALQGSGMRRIFGEVEIATMLKKIKGRTLKQTEKNYLYRSIRPKIAAAQALCQSEIPQALKQPKKDDSASIEYNLEHYGVPFLSLRQGVKSKRLSLEGLIIHILAFSPYARHIEAVPILLAKNSANPMKLLELAIKTGTKNKLGYMIETAQMLKRKKEYEQLLSYLDLDKDADLSFLAEGDRDFLEKTSPSRVKRWNLLGRFFDEDFKRNAKVYLC